MKWFVTCPRLLVTVKKGNLKILFLANSTETQKCRWRLRALLVSFRRQACGSRRCGMHPSSFRRNFPEIYNYIRALATKKAHRLGWAICPSQETPQQPRAVSLSSALAVTGRALIRVRYKWQLTISYAASTGARTNRTCRCTGSGSGGLAALVDVRPVSPGSKSPETLQASCGMTDAVFRRRLSYKASSL